MRRGRRNASCRICHRHKDEVGEISARGKCAECGEALLLANVRQMKAHSGPNWRLWRQQMAACVGGRLLDEAADEPQTADQ